MNIFHSLYGILSDNYGNTYKHNVNTLLYMHSIGPKCEIAGGAGARYLTSELVEVATK
jgi:hypothetical protein